MAESTRTTTRPSGTAPDRAEPHDGGTGRPFTRLVRHRAVRLVALVALLLLDLAIPLAYARQSSLVLPTMHLDGSFQTASGLFRLESGQWPGKDFFPYLGIGPVMALFPV